MRHEEPFRPVRAQPAQSEAFLLWGSRLDENKSRPGYFLFDATTQILWGSKKRVKLVQTAPRVR